MHEVTHISYGDGGVDVVLDSSSQTSVAAPNFRFGDYAALVSSCFTPKELDRISEGNTAEITFYFVVTDEIEDELLQEQYQGAISENESELGNLSEGILIDLSATKVIGADEPSNLVSCANDVELQMDIPLFLVKEDRSYYILADNRGEMNLLPNATPEADVVTVNTHNFCPGLLLYQDANDSLIQKEDNRLMFDMHNVCFVGIVLLVILWIFIDHHHKKCF
ncbi:MAG: hypothetical protein K6F75_14040 [Butyrivibrio sp.]|nr:hypothetical protein [Butyrivibrio sp.]